MNKIIIMGKSSAGKDFFCTKLAQMGLKKIITYTTRPMRQGEVNNKDYHFIKEEQFLKMVKEKQFLEWRSYDTVEGKWYYGSTTRSYNDGDFIILTLDGIKNIAEKLKEEGIDYTTLLLTADDDTRLKRALKRGDNPEEIKRRIQADNMDFVDAEKYADIILDTSIMLPCEIDDFAKALIEARKNM